MIHQYKNNGYNIVLDVNSGSVHVVDELVYDVIALLEEGKSEQETVEALKDRYPEAELLEALDECRELAKIAIAAATAEDARAAVRAKLPLLEELGL